MTEPGNRKEGFKKCRSATFSIDGYSFTIGEHFGGRLCILAIFRVLKSETKIQRGVCVCVGAACLSVRIAILELLLCLPSVGAFASFLI